MGEQPEWYVVIKAAQYLGVAPWELLQKPTAWIDMAIGAMNAEEHAREMHQKRDSMRTR